MNNDFIKYKKTFDERPKQWLYSTEEAIKNSPKYKNFFDVIIPSLQHSRILSVARLLDSAYFRDDETKPNLSIRYILKWLDNAVLKDEIEKELNKNSKFTNSINNMRVNFIAHNTLKQFDKKIEAGIEDFFINLNWILNRIINETPHLKWCNDMNLDFYEKLSEAGVNDIFSQIIIN